jgi:ATP-dependent Clp protease ATP-binding subunit ClpC
MVASFSTLWPLLLVLAAVVGLGILWRRPSAGNMSKSTQTLSQFSRDLTELARAGKLDPVIGREEEIERVIQVLCRRTKNNPVLVGKAGVGKTAIAEGLAQAIVAKVVPTILRSKRILALDLPGLVAGTKYRGEFEQRLKHIADEITAAKRQIILFIDEIHALAGAGGAEGAVDADDIFKPALARGDLQVIGATTVEEYKEFIQKDITLDRRLHPILVDEPTNEETVSILKGIKRKYELHHSVVISDEAIDHVVALVAKFATDKAFPDKAIDLMDEAASKVSIEHSDHSGDGKIPEVTKYDAEAVIAEWQKDRV